MGLIRLWLSALQFIEYQTWRISSKNTIDLSHDTLRACIPLFIHWTNDSYIIEDPTFSKWHYTELQAQATAAKLTLFRKTSRRNGSLQWLSHSIKICLLSVTEPSKNLSDLPVCTVFSQRSCELQYVNAIVHLSLCI